MLVSDGILPDGLLGGRRTAQRGAQRNPISGPEYYPIVVRKSVVAEKWLHVRFRGTETERVRRLTRHLLGRGYSFDTGTNLQTGEVDWELDWSYKGPVSRKALVARLKRLGFKFRVSVCSEQSRKR